MRVALKSSNNKYVCAEQGGGIYYNGLHKNEAYPGVAPVYANRDSIGPWETFELIKNNNSSVSFKTSGGYYLTAEYGGGAGLSTNRTELNAWEMFFIAEDHIICWNGLNVLCAEQGSDSHVNGTRDAVGEWERFTVEQLDNPDVKWPSNSELRNFKGNLCGMPLSLPYAPNGILFTPSYVVYNDDIRDRIRKAYLDNGHTHFPINLTNHSPIYRSYYPHWDDTLINKYLEELLKDDIVPVGFVMGDNDNVVSCKADPSLVPITVPKWEDPAPLRYPSHDEWNTFSLVKEKYPKSLLYWHNPVGQGAPFISYSEWGLPQGDPSTNSRVWNYMVKECGVVGLLFQGQAWEDSGASSIAGLNDFAVRFKDNLNGWPTADLIDYEEVAYYMFNQNGDYNKALKITQHIRNSVQRLNGFCNG